MLEQWDDESCDWQGLDSPSQRPRYDKIADLILSSCGRGATILDIGCGEGVLLRYLPPTVQYVGIDPSRKAILGFRSDQLIHQVFIATAEQYQTTSEFDCIVFNEMLYYCENPRAVLDKYISLLKPSGILIVSIYQKQEPFFKRILRACENLKCTKLLDKLLSPLLIDRAIVTFPATAQHWIVWAARK